MRLLRYDEQGNLSLTKFFGGDIPPYAILSHTWSDEEVLFKDVTDGATASWKSKAGYRKLEFCGRQAAKDGLSFFWVDTCCIDKSSSMELGHAISSMFRWYKDAARCYVYLQDVRLESDSEQTMSSLLQSKWFSRSWTLQELLAPKAVEFFDLQGDLIGDRNSMTMILSNYTGIPRNALQGGPLVGFSVEDRLSWASERNATFGEDRAYSLLGIFGVYIPLIYGEGETNAFKRLMQNIETDTMPFAQNNRTQATLQSPTASYYGSLAENGFRLLLLEPGPLGSEMIGRMQEFDLSNAPPYYALSYVWGQEPALHRIAINNTITRIRPNLFYALQRIRALQNVGISLWVDSVSIDQLNDVERSAQVTRMAQIYNKAAGVYIWLDEEDATSKIAIELVNKVHAGIQGENLQKTSFPWAKLWWKDYSFTALSLLMERPWFRRGWVIQEAAFSKHSIIQCGDRQLQLKHVTEVTNLIRSKFNSEPQAPGILSTKTRTGTLMNFIDSPAVRLLDLIQKSFEKTADGSILNHLMSLEMLVHLATFSETSNEQDTIYTLLNLANDQSSLSRHNQGSVIVPDYSKSTISVYTDFVRYCYSENGSLDIICRPWAPSSLSRAQENSGDDQELTYLPSWIASREKLPYGDPSWRSKHRLHGNPLVGSPLKPTYNADGGSKPQASQGSDVNRSCILSGKGFAVGRIKQRSSRMADAIITQECLSLLGDPRKNSGAEYTQEIRTWWRTLCADRDGNGDPAPDSWVSAMENLLVMLNSETASVIDIEELLDTDIPELVRTYLLVVRDIVWNRRTFRSDINSYGKQFVGLVPPNARIGDQICILYGCSVPVVLRKLESPDQTLQWQLVGDAYVHGIMDGEFLRGLTGDERREKEQTFAIR
ncbi:hypothetical protein HBI06_172690 [Parastagonospora nodorum]|nr:hypothetical protein HBI06_172690 [Parastagonospora nodorum]KAH4232724.1 hypothetical protein HBI05_169660 [Parastagonospora nodorum]KAH5069913.1 hypothetical protein HBH95_184700 [Parastagonospora nodorum]